MKGLDDAFKITEDIFHSMFSKNWYIYAIIAVIAIIYIVVKGLW